MFKALIAGRSKDEIKKRLVTYVDDKIYSFDEDEMIFTTTEVLIENRDNEKSIFKKLAETYFGTIRMVREKSYKEET